MAIAKRVGKRGTKLHFSDFTPTGSKTLVEVSSWARCSKERLKHQERRDDLKERSVPFCPKCAAQTDPGASFCARCGATLRNIPAQTPIELSMKEKGASLEDSVADYFRRRGFDVEPRAKMRDRFDVYHEIDVLGSKKEDFGTIQVAVECKYVRTPMDIKEVRNFHDKLAALGITKGVFVSTGGFTADAESHAKALGIELWDMTTLQTKLAEETPQKDVIHDALPVKLTMLSILSPRHLRNFSVLSETTELVYRPYYFMDYHCFSQHTVAGNSVLLESGGKIVVDGVNGQIVDCMTSEGQTPHLPIVGAYVACSQMETQTLPVSNLPSKLPLSVIRHELDSVRAKDRGKIELVKNLSLQYRYETTRTIGEKILKPRKKDIDIHNLQGPVRVPILVGTYRFGSYSYVRTWIAATGAIATDQTASCLLCHNPATLVCENCGGISCASHGKNCVVCGKNLCGTCASAKGIVSKKYYCPQHQPR